MNFVFQKDFNHVMDEYGIQLQQLCAELDINFYPITVVPFEHTVVEADSIADLQGYTVAYGSNVMKDVVDAYGWKPGWFSIADKETEAYDVFGDHYINHDMFICNTDNYMEAIKEHGMYDVDYYFMKPNDQKYFPGTIVDKPMMPFVIESQGRHHGTPDVYDLCISTVKYIEAEWRFFVIDGNIVDGSKYHAANLKLDVQAGFESNAGEFAKQMIDLYDSTGTFVIDIAKMQDGSYKVVEINCLNSSGLYKIDLKKFLVALKYKLEEENFVNVFEKHIGK